MNNRFSSKTTEQRFPHHFPTVIPHLVYKFSVKQVENPSFYLSYHKPILKYELRKNKENQFTVNLFSIRSHELAIRSEPPRALQPAFYLVAIITKLPNL